MTVPEPYDKAFALVGVDDKRKDSDVTGNISAVPLVKIILIGGIVGNFPVERHS